MTAYFDDRAREIREAARHMSDTEFMQNVAEIEADLFADVTRVTGDVEFPADLRGKILGLFACQSVWQPGGVPVPKRATDHVRAKRASFVLEEVHAAFRELAARGVDTRFGRLSDSPIQIELMRVECEEKGK